MTPSLHPDSDLLFDYAAGTLSEAAALMVATHLTYCPHCRGEVSRLEAVGGAVLDLAPPVTVRTTSADLLARLDTLPPAEAAPEPAPLPAAFARLPRPLHPYLRSPGLSWRPVTKALQELPLAAEGGRARLMAIRAGQAMPRHTHRGREMVMVLAGGYSDEMGHYGRGDFSITTDDHTHTPVADADGDCLCLALVEGHLRLTGILGAILNPFMKF